MQNCKSITKLLSLSCEQKLSVWQRAQLRWHLWRCPRCRAFAQNSKTLDEMMKRFCQQETKK